MNMRKDSQGLKPVSKISLEKKKLLKITKKKKQLSILSNMIGEPKSIKRHLTFGYKIGHLVLEIQIKRKRYHFLIRFTKKINRQKRLQKVFQVKITLGKYQTLYGS